MNAKDIWYGVLDAGGKTSPVVRYATLDASEGKIWLYNHHRNQFIEYAKAIVEPKLRELTAGDIPQKELNKAFKAKAGHSHLHARSVHGTDTKPTAPRVKKENAEDELDIIMSDDEDIEEATNFDD